MLSLLRQLTKNSALPGDCLPLELIVFITRRCNLSCRHCFVERPGGEAGEELKLAEFEALSRELPGLLSLMLTGGEPFLRDDLPEIIDLFDMNSKPRVISLITNGALTEKVRLALDRLARKDIAAELILSVSIDGDPRTHNRIRGGEDVYASAIDTLEMLKTHPFRGRLSLGMNITVSRENQNVPYAEYKKLLESSGMDFASVNLVRGRRPGDYEEVDIRKYGELIRSINRFNKVRLKKIPRFFRFLHGLKEERQGRLVEKTYREKSYQGLVCEAGRGIGVVDDTGGVYPCELLDRRFGSIREESFRDIWNRPENVLFARDRIRRKQCFCHHECFLSASINLNLVNQLRWWKGLLPKSPWSRERLF